jgi:hypothetical protein
MRGGRCRKIRVKVGEKVNPIYLLYPTDVDYSLPGISYVANLKTIWKSKKKSSNNF